MRAPRYFARSVLAPAESRALTAENYADAEWIEWCRAAVHHGVRFDLDPVSLKELPWLVEVAPGTFVRRGGDE